MTIATGDGWTMTSGSCLDPITGLASLADDSIDVTIMDPPYEDEAHTKGKRQNPTSERRKATGRTAAARVVDETFAFEAIDERTRSSVAMQVGRVTTKWAGVFCQVEAVHLWRAALEATGMMYRRTIPWVKPDAMPCLHGLWPGQAFEALVIVGRPGCEAPVGGKARYYTDPGPSCYDCTRERGDTRAHPTAKPLELMRRIVEDFTNPDELVLDAFAGSGTTGVACGQLGRRFVGWEMLDGTVPVKVPIKDKVAILKRGVPTGKFRIKATGKFRTEYPNYFDVACSRLRGEGGRVNPAQIDMFATSGAA